MRQKYNITREQVDYLLSNVGDKDLIDSKLKSWFPIVVVSDTVPTQVNEVNGNELKRNTWYRNTEGVGGFIFHKSDGVAFGTTNISEAWYDNGGWGLSRESERALYVEATEEEIRSFLIRVAKEKGYSQGNYTCLGGSCTEGFNRDFNFAFLDTGRGGLLYTMPDGYGGNLIFRDGEWAELKPIEN
jgi:hypothetical protein